MDDSTATDTTELGATDPETRHLLGLFDVPAFARRGQDLEFYLHHLTNRVNRERDDLMSMIRVRLKQWAAAVEGPEAWRASFARPIEPLWPLSGAIAPAWAAQVAPPRRRLAIARDLVHSVERFNRRWTRFVTTLDLAAINGQIDRYNRYYVLEKECVLGSGRLAARNFRPRVRLTPEGLMADHPLLPVPELRP